MKARREMRERRQSASAGRARQCPFEAFPRLPHCPLCFSFPRYRHFEAFKSPRPTPSFSRPKPSPPLPQVDDDELKAILGDDHSPRFVALGGSLYPSLSSSSSHFVASANLVPSGTSFACDGRDLDPSCSNPNNEEDEVEKIIQWAKDATRLDPSLPFDEESRDDDEDEDNDLEITQRLI
ncbi:hypothetical protein CRG98_031240 [Punica granatum]|uniref:Uncharacterized protein n=1 Tax=Punica granatum TaxID=22663 RepID=A0A2I0IWK5_PUNGR|nr:hypothetical protein CRG98_031240 [Punica granatum]